MELKKVNVHETNGSCFVYIPKVWVTMMNLKKGNKVVWNIKEENFKILQLEKINEG